MIGDPKGSTGASFIGARPKNALALGLEEGR